MIFHADRRHLREIEAQRVHLEQKAAAEARRAARIAAHEERAKAEAAEKEARKSAKAAEIEDARIWNSIARRLYGPSGSRLRGLRMAAKSAAIDRAAELKDIPF